MDGREGVREMKKLMAVAMLAYAIFWVGFNGNMWGPFMNYSDCQSWAYAYQMYGGSCQFRMM
jgi:hypothetical protein